MKHLTIRLSRHVSLPRIYLLGMLLPLACLTAELPLNGQNRDLRDAVGNHGGAAIEAARTIDIRGTSTRSGGQSTAIRIRATLDRLDASHRVDYGDPATRSVVTTSSGRFEIQGNDETPRSRHSGAFTQFDMLAGFGLRHYLAPGVTRTPQGERSVGGRPSKIVRVETGREIRTYGRMISDIVDIDIDLESGLVSAVSRTGYADQSLDRQFLSIHRFSDYRVVDGAIVPFRIERYTNGALMEVIVVDSIALNPILPLNIFERSRQ